MFFFHLHKSDTVRLGEHDTSTTTDGEHIDIPVDRVETHKNFSSYLIFNMLDIALVHMKRHVDFNGELKFYSFNS